MFGLRISYSRVTQSNETKSFWGWYLGMPQQKQQKKNKKLGDMGGGFLKMVGFPNQPNIGFFSYWKWSKLGLCEMGVRSHHLRKHPNILLDSEEKKNVCLSVLLSPGFFFRKNGAWLVAGHFEIASTWTLFPSARALSTWAEVLVNGSTWRGTSRSVSRLCMYTPEN